MTLSLQDTQAQWRKYTSVNSNSGVLHPMVYEHPISKQTVIYLHLGTRALAHGMACHGTAAAYHCHALKTLSRIWKV